jgi:hypothetical protein
MQALKFLADTEANPGDPIAMGGAVSGGKAPSDHGPKCFRTAGSSAHPHSARAIHQRKTKPTILMTTRRNALILFRYLLRILQEWP